METLSVEEDVLHRFLLEGAGVRGVMVRLGASWRDVAGRADYPAALHVRLYGMNGLGKVYTLDRNYTLTK